MAYDFALPLGKVLPTDILPVDQFEALEGLENLLMRVYLVEYSETVGPGQAKTIDVGLSIAQEAVFTIPGLEGISLVVGGLGGALVKGRLELAPDSWAFTLAAGARLRFSRDWLRPVVREQGAWVDHPTHKYAELAISAGIRIDNRWSISFAGPNDFRLDPAMIAETGLVLEGTVILDLSETSSQPETLAMGLGPTWRGVVFKSLVLYLPDDWDVPLAPDDIKLKNFHIGSGGLCGLVQGDWAPQANGEDISGSGAGRLFGMPFGLVSLRLEFVQGALTVMDIKALLGLPFFKITVDVELGIDLQGGVTVLLGSKTGIVEKTIAISGADLATLKIKSFGVEYRPQVTTISLSGSLRPKYGAPALEWPEFAFDKLSVDSNGHVSLPGGWLDLSNQKPLSFYGFELAITKLGFGRTDDGGNWIGFSGGIKLVEGLPMGASVEGLRVTWYSDGRQNPFAVTLNGVGVEFTVPNVLEFKGAVSYNTIPKPGGGVIHRFDGAIKLNIVTINLQIDSMLVVGSDEGPQGRYNFFAIYVGVELPSGIPLGNTGVAIFGFAGLFAYQMEPNKGRHDLHPELPADEGWYENEDGGPGWYKRNEMGVTDLKHKWDPVRDSLAFGVGATLGTMADGGTAFHAKLLLAIVFPGPIIMLEGRGNLLKKRADAGGKSTTSSEPLFRTIAVLDFRLGTLTFGLSAWYKYDDKGSVIDITGSAEAFFDFNNPGGWHVYVGRDEPQQYRVHAYILNKLFEANSYFMLSKRSFKTGVWVGLKYGWKYGPLTAAVEVSLDGKASISHKPPQYYGGLLIRGSLILAAFGFGVTMIVQAEATADVYDPYHILLLLSGELKLPWPLPSFKGAYKKEWGPLPLPPLLPLPLKEIAVEHPVVSTVWPLPAEAGLLRPVYDDGNGFLVEPANPGLDPDPALIPVVPLDARPHLNFGRHVRDEAKIAVNPQPDDRWERIGDPEQNRGPALARFSLRDVVLEKWVGGGTPWAVVARASGTPKKLYGAWAPVLGPDGGVAQNRLMLSSRNAFDYTRHGGRAWSEGFAADNPAYPCVPDATEREVCCDFAGLQPGQALHSPWRCPENPDITLSWSPGGDPVVTVLDPPVNGLTRGLCFPGSVPTGGGTMPNDIVVSLPPGRPPRKVTVTPAQDSVTRQCLYFESRAPGAGPAEEQGISFATDGAPGTRIAAFGGVTGLDCGSTLVLVLPRACMYAELTLSTRSFSLANAPAVQALRRNGPPAQVEMQSAGPELVRLKEPDIVGIVVSAPVRETLLHQICLVYVPVDGEGRDALGNPLLAAISDTGVLTAGGDALETVHLNGGDRVCIARVCAVLPPDAAEVAERQAMTQRFQGELARWYGEADLLDLDTVYRLTVETTVEAKGEGELDGWQQVPNPRVQRQYAYFRTQGPPGLALLSLPAGASPDGQDVLRAPNGQLVLKSSLDTLAPYVRQTLPPTVPAPSERPPLPRPVYRAYDTGVEFSVDYVDLMYRLRRRGLGLYLFDNNNRPARDTEGRLITPVNRWGAAERLWLTDGELLWIRRTNANGCASLDLDKIPRSKTLFTSDPGLVLEADTLYEGRLVPLLLDEDFAAGKDDWRVVDEGTRNAPSRWETRKSLTGTSATAAGSVVNLDGAPDLSAVDVSVDSLLLASDQARASQSYRILSVDIGGNRVTVDGTPQLAGGTSRWLIPLGSVQQRSFINGGPIDGRDPNKPGTMLLAGDASWSDYRFAVTLRSSDDGAIGLVFRASDAMHYYRFSMSRDDRYRRLVRVRGNEQRILGEEYFVFQVNRDYRVVVEAMGKQLRVYLDDVVVFNIEDDTLATGGVGLYCWQNAGARFSDVRVDDFRQDAPVVYRYQFTASRFADFFHQVHSFQDETWRAVGARPALDAAVIQAAALANPPSDDEARAYQALLDAVLPGTANQNPPQVQVTYVEEGSAVRALLVQSPEPIDWSRTSLNVTATDRPAAPGTPPAAVKLTTVQLGAAQPSDEWAELLAREPVDLSGYRIEYRAFPASTPEPADGELLFADSFRQPPAGLLFEETFGPAALDRYEIIAEEAPSGSLSAPWAPDWTVANNRIEQGSLYRGGTAATDNLPPRPGTIALSQAGMWSNVRIRATLQSASAHDIGIVFRWQDEDNYYRFSVSRFVLSGVSPFRRLVKKVGGAVQVLWQDDGIAHTDQPCSLVIETFGDRLVGYWNDELLFSLRDASLSSGRVGLYCWGNNRAYFEGLQVEALEADPVLWQPAFGDLSEMTLVEPPNLASGVTADWQVQVGALLQRAEVAGLEGTLERLPGAARDIAISPDGDVYVVGVDPTPHGYGVYLWNGAGWIRIGGDAVRIAAAPRRTLLRVDDGGNLYVWPPAFLRGQLPVPSPVTDITVDLAGTPWIVGSDPATGGYTVYRWNGAAWDNMGIGAMRVTVGRDGRAWAVNDEAHIYFYDGAAWQQAPGGARDIAAGPDGSLWRLDDRGAGPDFALGRLEGSGWEAMFGAGSAIAVAPDGRPWLVDSAGRISRWRGSPLHKPGACAVGGDLGWQDARVCARLRSDSDGAIGVMLRYRDADNYYRFAMDRKTGSQSLTKRVNGEMTELWQRAWTYNRNQSYELTWQAVGTELRAYLDGQALFTVFDGDLRIGQVGLYCRANGGAYFERLVVEDVSRRVGRWTLHDEGDVDAPSTWRLSDGALSQTSSIRGSGVEERGACALAGEPDWADVRALVRLRSDDAGAIGVLFRYVDPDNYYRFAMDQGRHYRRLVKVIGGNATVLWEDTGRGYNVGDVHTLTVEACGADLAVYLDDTQLCAVADGTHAAGRIGLYCSNNPGARFEDVEVSTYPAQQVFSNSLLQDPFSALVPGRWSFQDRGNFNGGSNWFVNPGELRQAGGIGFLSLPWGTRPGEPATLATAGDRRWTDYRLSVSLGSYPVLGGTASEVGVVFRYQDVDDYYWFRMNHQTGSRQLLRRQGGQATLLWQDVGVNSRGQVYRLDIDCLGPHLRGYLDDTLLFDLVDAALSAGSVGLVCTGNAGAFFREVRVVPPTWRLYYQFRDERRLQAGTRVRVLSQRASNGAPEEAGVSYRTIARPYEAGRLHFRADGADLRLTAPAGVVGGAAGGAVQHMRSFVTGYTRSPVDWRILRKADGTGFVLVSSNGAAIPPAGYRLKLTYRRDNRQVEPDSPALSRAGSRDPEEVTIDLPWQRENV